MDPRSATLARRYKAAIPKQAETYDRLFKDLVAVVDGLTDAAKKIPEGLRALDQLERHIEGDPAVAEMDSLQKYAPTQQVGFLREKLLAAQKAITHLEYEYDDSNRSFLRMKLR